MRLRSRVPTLTATGCVLCAVLACAFEACALKPPPAINNPHPGSPGITGTLSTDAVWGVADLHAHPAAHIAFGGLDGEAGLIWGAPGQPGGGAAYIPGGDLPDIAACDPETHEANVTDEISRFTRGLVFENLTKTTNYPHDPHGDQNNDGEPAYAWWPNGRDILHQAMNIQSIRRAYDGGLRLMFASTVEAQLIGFAMHATIFPEPFSPSRAVEMESAEQQLQYIQAMASANADWMEIASTPEEAESAILQGRLALIPALEQDGLLLEDIQYLVQTYGVGAIVPVHLVDNDVGGTAAYEDLFNSATYLEGAMFGYTNRYISVEADPSLDFHLGTPADLSGLGIAYDIGNISYQAAAPLGYSQYPACCPPAPGVPPNIGERNSVGLRSPQTISTLMAMGLMIDVAHMGFHSTDDTVTLARNTCGYPLLDTHTNVHTQGGNERNLYLQHANYVSTSQGVMGFGSSGNRTSERTVGPNAGGTSTIASARGGPLLSFGGGSSSFSTIQFPKSPDGSFRACDLAFSDDTTRLQVNVSASAQFEGGDVVYLQFSFDDGTQSYALVPLNRPSPVTISESIIHVNGISINAINPSQCGYGDGPIGLEAVTIADAQSSTTLVSTTPGSLGNVVNQAPASFANLESNRSSFQLYSRCPSGDATICDSAETYLQALPLASLPDRHVQITMTPGTKTLQSATALTHGARVGASLCVQLDCSDNPPNPCDNPEFTMTAAGGWPNGQELDAYYRIPRGSADPTYGAIEICLTEPDLVGEPWELDSVNVNLVVDPTRLWAGDYQNFLAQIFAGREGALALGTDINGLAPQFPFSDFRPAYANEDAGAACQVTSDAGTSTFNAANETYGDEASGGTFTLQRPLRIGSTPLCFPDRGLATYGMLPEFFDAVYHYNPTAYRSLFQSAKEAIAAWKASRAAAAQFATAPDSCVVPGAPVATVTPLALVSCASQAGGDAGDDGGVTEDEAGIDYDAAIPRLCGDN